LSSYKAHMKTTILLIILCFATSTFGADLRGLKDLFARSYWSGMYVNNYCRENIERFVQRAQEDGINLDNSYMVQIVNDGFDMFGLVSAISVREQGRLIEPRTVKPPFRNIGTSNWNYHFIMIADGEVFDFDFTNKNKVVKLSQYMTEQFIPVNKVSDVKYKKDKIGPYKFTIYPAVDYMEYLQRRVSMDPIRNEIKFRDYLPEYFR
jgi:hypothetical protein